MKGKNILLIALLLFGISVFGGFVQDDLKVVSSDPEMGKIGPIFASFARPYYYMDEGNAGIYRPLTSASLYLNALITKSAWGFRLVNILMYAGVCVLLFEFLRKIISEKNAFWTTIIFAVLPIHTEVVNNIVGRAEIVSLGFVLLSILMQGKAKWELSALMFLAALFSKETAIVGLPVLLYLLILGKEKREVKGGVATFYILVTICFMVLRTVVLGNGLGNNATIVENPLKFVSASQRVMNAFALVPFGISKIIFPLHLSYDYSFNQLKLVTSWFDWRVILGIIMMLGSIASLFTKLRRNKLWILGQAFFWGPIMVIGNFLFPVGTIFGERLWFWPSLGVIMLIVSLISFRPHSLLATDNLSLPASDNYLDSRLKFSSSKKPSNLSLRSVAQRKKICKEIAFFKLAKYFGFALILIFATRTFIRNLDWLSQERLFLHDATYVKDSVLAQNNRAAMYLLRKDFEGSQKALEDANKIYPKYPELLNNNGMYFLWIGDKEKAKEKFEDCLQERPGYYLCEDNLKLLNDIE